MMNCNVISDLLPLYIDSCCSEESAEMVKAHLLECKQCKRVYDSMKSENVKAVPVRVDVKPKKVNLWKASLLQSVLMFISFALIVLGVTFEAATPVGKDNGIWAWSLIVPATGFMISLANWYFVRVYKDAKTFSVCSLLATAGVTGAGFLWALVHFGAGAFSAVTYCIGIALSLVFCLISKVLSGKYAQLLSKD